MMVLASWIPFVSPMNWMQSFWYLTLIPLAFGIAMIYKAIRVTHLRTYWVQVGMLSSQIILTIVLLAIALIVFVRFIIPAA